MAYMTNSFIMTNGVLHASRYVRFGCFVDDVAQFDAGAFRLASGEATAMDPQTRLALEQTQVCMHYLPLHFRRYLTDHN